MISNDHRSERRNAEISPRRKAKPPAWSPVCLSLRLALPAGLRLARLAGLGLVMLGAAATAVAQDPFAENVRSTEPLAPLDQLQSFTPLPGLAVDLIAAEPVIQKPLNMAFDVRGRLWVTCTIEYPYPAAEGQGRDRIVILEDTNRDGSFDQHTVFADNLNIPIGILPMGDDCLVFDIPYISRFFDTDGDGVCDQRQRILGPFDCSRDTHGMNNSFIQGFDGWVYACHGFANRSMVAGADGHRVTMNSGNVYRFRPDGSRIEHVSYGQVNPYGMACDDWFTLFTADCHSKPLTQVMRGAYYPSFGAPHDGLGFAPSMMEHFHGSTAIAGVEVLAALNFPAAYAGQLVSGNVMTSRINRNRLEWQGAYAQAIEQPDLLATSDPWFRPVSLIQGPDGGLYVADFYNRIIGHYEVPLQHPGRDRDRGRVWRLRDATVESTALAGAASSVTASSPLEQLVAMFEHPVVRTRLAAVNEVVARVEAGTIDRAAVVECCQQRLGAAAIEKNSVAAQVASLWCLLRVDPVAWSATVESSWMSEAPPLVRAHVQRALSEAWPEMASGPEPAGRGPRLSWPAVDFQQRLAAGLSDSEPRVLQAAIDAAGRWGSEQNLPSLVELASADSGHDPVVIHAARVALKETLLGPAAASSESGRAVPAAPSTGGVDELSERRAACWRWIKQSELSSERQRTLAHVMLAVPSREAADFLIDYLAEPGRRDDSAGLMIQHIAKHLPTDRAGELVGLIQSQHPENLPAQWELLLAVGEGLSRSGQATPPPVWEWANGLVQQALRELAEKPVLWQAVRLDGRQTPAANEQAWQVQWRPVAGDLVGPGSADGQNRNVAMLSSLPAGETRTGILRSQEFRLPARLHFALAGHRGFPDQGAHELNQVRLRLETGEVIRTAFPPRNDLAQWIEWDLAAWEGQLATVEIQDGDTAGAYAWLAVGEFSVPALAVPQWSPGQLSEYVQALCRVVARFRLQDADSSLQALLLGPGGLSPDDRLLVARTLADLRGQGFGRAFAEDLMREDLHPEIKQSLASVIALSRQLDLLDPPDDPNLRHGNSYSYLRDWLPQLNARQQRLLVRAATNEAAVFERVLGWAESGHLAVDCFNDPGIQQQVKVAENGRWWTRVERLLADIPPTDEAWRERAAAANARFQPWLEQLRNGQALAAAALPRDTELAQDQLSGGDLVEWKRLGQQVFQRDCAACHQLAGQGAVVGPQLDGIHRRGLERVLEDVLLPNQNVDHAFRSQVLLLDNGQILVGLVQAEDEAAVQLTDPQGKSRTIPVVGIEERRMTPQSLMPNDIAHGYSDTTLLGLMVYLLEQ